MISISVSQDHTVPSEGKVVFGSCVILACPYLEALLLYFLCCCTTFRTEQTPTHRAKSCDGMSTWFIVYVQDCCFNQSIIY